MTKGEQMMADLGYVLINVMFHGRFKFFRKTALEESPETTKVYEIAFDNGQASKDCVVKQPENHKCFYYPDVCFDYDELLACAEIVKEIKENG